MKFIFGDSLSVVIDDEYFEVVFIDKPLKAYESGMAYIIGNDKHVIPYRGDSSVKGGEAGIYKANDGSHLIIKSTDDKYSVENVNSYDVDSIFRTISTYRDQFVNVKDVEIINNNSEIYYPTIEEDDDFLKVAIKKAIREKRINLNNYKDKFGTEYTLVNMKSGLRKSTKMTVVNFLRWCEILGLDWTITLTDSGDDRLTPLRMPVVISSNDVEVE